MSKKIILIAGPTSSGKSKLAISLAKKINGEIVNADSMQVYKEFSILSSRPSKKDLKKIKHHFYGFTSVKKIFSTGMWLKLVENKIYKILKIKKIPILVGGTGLYFNSITKGMSKIPKINKQKRQKVRTLHERIGQAELYKKLINIDPVSKNKILPTDKQRTIRAYEVKLYTKKSLYEWTASTKSKFLKFDIRKIYLDIPRDKLLKNIEMRINQMFKSNCIEEVIAFKKLKIDESLSANKIIGVSEISDYLLGINNIDLTKELINIKTRQYAKRQNTWSRGHMKNWNKLYYKDLSILLRKVLKLIT